MNKRLITIITTCILAGIGSQAPAMRSYNRMKIQQKYTSLLFGITENPRSPQQKQISEIVLSAFAGSARSFENVEEADKPAVAKELLILESTNREFLSQGQQLEPTIRACRLYWTKRYTPETARFLLRTARGEKPSIPTLEQ